jgi:acyl-CoA thioester hydrolase
MSEEFCYLLRVRYSECDAQKVVFNGRYIDYVDIAVTEFMRVVWGNYNDILAKDIDNQVVSLSVNWQAPAHFDDVLAIMVKPIKTGMSSYTLQVDFYNYDSQKKLASAEIIYVMVSAAMHQKMKIPEDMRKQLMKGACGIKINHSGLK